MWHFFKERGLYQWMSVTSFFRIVMMSYDSLASWLYVDLHLLTSKPRSHKLTKVHVTIKFNTRDVFILVCRSLLTPIKICYAFIKAKYIYTSIQVQKPALLWYCENCTSCGAQILSLQTFLYKKCAYTHIRIQNHHIKESKQYEQYIYKVHFFLQMIWIIKFNIISLHIHTVHLYIGKKNTEI